MRKNGHLEDDLQISTLKKNADSSALWGDDKLADVLVQLVLPKRGGGAGEGKAKTPPIAEGSTSANAGDDDIGDNEVAWSCAGFAVALLS